jgi:hypothetical protein
MKKSLLLSCIATLCLSASVFAQTIRRCNNNPGITGVNVYTTIQAAHNAAVAGDIIYVEPSSASYGNLNCTKRLTIIGNGYYLDKNTNNSFDTRTSKIDQIVFDNGSANSVLTGIEQTGSGFSVNDLNITITRCYVTNSIVFGLSTNLVAGQNSRGNNGTITKCVLGSGINGTNSTTVASQYGYNCLISNNIQRGSTSGMTNTVISNNVYYCGYTGTSNLGSLFGCAVTNNIFDARGLSGTLTYVGGGSGNTISNNICLDLAGSPSGNGNVSFGTSTATFLTANPWTTFSTEDANFQLIAGSPAIGIGTGGTNAGAFGGSNPYILSGMPAYPVITTYLPSGVGNTSTPLQVSVTVRGNN